MVVAQVRRDERTLNDTEVQEPALGRLPDFIAVGPPRTGTSWLHKFLMGSVGLPANTKETNFFDLNYKKGIAFYQAFFRKCPGDLPVGEIAPTYFHHEKARERIATHIPDCKIICTLRDPVERLHSTWRLAVWNGKTNRSFEKQIDALWEPSFNESNYVPYLKAWQQTFCKDRVLIALYDDFIASPQNYVNAICDFVGISRIPIGSAPVTPEDLVNTIRRVPRGRLFGQFFRWTFRIGWDRRNKVDASIQWLRQRGLERALRRAASHALGETFQRVIYKEIPSLRPETEARLRGAFRRHVDALEQMLNRDLSAWKQVNTINHADSPDFTEGKLSADRAIV